MKEAEPMAGEGKKKHPVLYAIKCLLVAILILFIIIITIALISDDGESPSKETGQEAQSSETGGEESETEVPDGTETQDAGDEGIGIDGTMSADYFDLSIIDMKWTDALETSISTMAPEKEGRKLLCLIFSARNTTDEAKNLGVLSAYVDKKAVMPRVFLGTVDAATMFVGGIEGGMELDAYSVWELPEDWETFQVFYYESDGSGGGQHFVIHRSDIGE